MSLPEPTQSTGFFPPEEYAERLDRVREAMDERGFAACLISAPENVYYLTGLDHQGYFAYQALVLPLEGTPLLVTRAMEKAIVRDQVPDLLHVGYSDGIRPLPKPSDREEDLVFATRDDAGEPAGLRPWESSLGVSIHGPLEASGSEPAVEATLAALAQAGVGPDHRIGIEKKSAFLPFRIAESVVAGLPAQWKDCSGLVDDCRIVQSPLEQQCTREAARVSESMMLSAIATAGAGAAEQDVIAAAYDAMFRRGGTYPGFVPLVRSTRTIEHEHGTWNPGTLRDGDLLFLEMAGCVRRYHAPIGRLVFVGKAPDSARATQAVCRGAIERAAEEIGPGVRAGDVYRAWQSRIDEAGLSAYRRHHCGYSVGIGYPPSWSGSGTPRGLREDSELVLRSGMVFHLMSWLLRTGRGDSFLSDTVLVTDEGCELLTRVDRDVLER
ncbi:MAG: Xaa-Pro peptidase family protein [Thermoanaerobaculia bacterium]